MVAVLLLVAALPAAAQNHTPQHANSAPPRVFLLNAQELAALRAADVNDPRRQAVVGAAVAAADRAMTEGPFSVMDKQLVPPSGDKHDYMSRGTYWWPDPSKPDGLPYIRRDGQTNPENRKITDHEEFGRMSSAARALALAWYFTGKADYANRAALLLRTWFLDPATKMNPNLEFAQAILGVNTGRGTGVIDTRPLVDAIDAAGLLAGSTAWTVADDKGLHDWFAQYLHWMRTSKNGMDEDAAKNNHGNWYDVQVTSMELFLGDRKEAIDTLERVKTRRITVQIEPDGREPLELARTNAWGYSNFSLEALTPNWLRSAMKWAWIFGTSKPPTAVPFAPPSTSSSRTRPAKRNGTISRSAASTPALWRPRSCARPRPITIPNTQPWRNRSAQTETTSKPCCCATRSQFRIRVVS